MNLGTQSADRGVRGGLLAAHTAMRCFSGSGKRRPLLGLPQGDGSLGPCDEVWGPMSRPRPGPEKAETALPGKQRPVGWLPERRPFPLHLPAPQHLGPWQRRLGVAGMLAARVGGSGKGGDDIPDDWQADHDLPQCQHSSETRLSSPEDFQQMDCSDLKSDRCNQQLLNSYSPGKVSHQDPSPSLAMAKQERNNRERDGRAGRQEE